jgi:Uma2 family endonuclease
MTTRLTHLGVPAGTELELHASFTAVCPAVAERLAAGKALRQQLPWRQHGVLALPALTCAPEPDVALVALDTPTNETGRPMSAALVVEVAESSLASDRDRKGPLYAAGGIQEYWLVNLPDRCLAVYRQSVPDTTAFSGWRYQERQVLREGERVAPLVAPEVVITVDELLPTL